MAPSWIADRDLDHLGRALVGSEHAAHQEETDRERQERGAG